MGRDADRSGARVVVPFRSFEAEFELAQGEISPYAQMVRDVTDGVIPSAAEAAGWTVVDCGANVGLFSLFLKDAERVVAVEPNPEVCRRLAANLERNGIDGTVVQAAISGEEGTVRMDFAGPSVLSEIGAGESEVRATTLDTLFAENGLEAIDVLKLDVERHEIEALEGGSQALQAKRVKRIVAEFQDAPALAALDAHLRPLGYARTATGRFNARYEL